MLGAVKKYVVPTLLLVMIILSAIWVAFGVENNFNVTTEKVYFIWHDDGTYEVRHGEGVQRRPLLAVSEFISTFGSSTQGLIDYVVIRGDDVIAAFYNDNIEFPDLTDLGILEILKSVATWFGRVVLVIVDLLLFIVSMPLYFIVWVLNAFVGVLGFLVTGKNFENFDGLLDWIVNR